MNNNKFLIGSTLMLVAALFIGSMTAPDNFFMWFAATDGSAQIIRAILLAVLAILFFTNPPRSLVFRAFLGVFAVAIIMMTVRGVGSYSINFLDAVLYTEIAIIFGIEALEFSSEQQRGLQKGSALARE